MAVAVDALRAANWQRAGRKTVPPPEPVPRPGVGPKTVRSSLTPRQMRARIEDLRRRRRQEKG